MRRKLRVIAVLIALGSVAFWVATGANGGFTITDREVQTPDEVTGLQKHEWKRTFVPGTDFLALAVLTAAIITGGSFLFPHKVPKNCTSSQRT